MKRIRSETFIMMVRPVRQNLKEKGFTLVELLIVMAVGSIVLTTVMISFLSQHKSYLVQDDVVEMQQNLRLAVEMITSDIRSAGYNPTGADDVGIITATAGRFGFTQDLNSDGNTDDASGTPGEDPGEEVTYGFSLANDAGIDGVADSGSAPLGRNTGTATGIGGSGFQQLAENFHAIEFLYVLDDGSQVLAPTADQLGSIRSIVVSILAVTSGPDQNFTNSLTYTAASGSIWGPFNDNLRRRMNITTIQCRNLGL